MSFVDPRDIPEPDFRPPRRIERRAKAPDPRLSPEAIRRKTRRREPYLPEGAYYFYFPQRDVTLVIPENLRAVNGESCRSRKAMVSFTEITIGRTSGLEIGLTCNSIAPYSRYMPAVETRLYLSQVAARWIWDIYGENYYRGDLEGIHVVPGEFPSPDTISVQFPSSNIKYNYLTPVIGAFAPIIFTPEGKRTYTEMIYDVDVEGVDEDITEEQAARLELANRDFREEAQSRYNNSFMF